MGRGAGSPEFYSLLHALCSMLSIDEAADEGAS